nr:MAG TPA: hypothetical protein [Caudoviricetes sp.]
MLKLLAIIPVFHGSFLYLNRYSFDPLPIVIILFYLIILKILVK